MDSSLISAATGIEPRTKRVDFMPRRSVLGAIMIGLTGLLGGCGLLANYRFRCRISVVIETLSGSYTGSSVFEVETVPQTDLLTRSSGAETFVKGEAVAVDLPNGGTLFALLKTRGMSGNDNWAVMSMHALDPAFAFDFVATAKRLRSRSAVSANAAVLPQDSPLFVTFDDVTDPETVRLIDPIQLADIFGTETKRVSVTVELTDAPITFRLQRLLPWIRDTPTERLDNDFQPTVNPTLAQQLRHGDFRRVTFR